MHPGFKEEDIDFDIKDGIKGYSILQICSENKKESSEKDDEEREEREKNVRRMISNRDILRRVNNEQRREKVKGIISNQESLIELSKWIRNNRRNIKGGSKRLKEKYNMYIKWFSFKWRKICNDIKKDQSKTLFFRNVNSLWDVKDVRVIYAPSEEIKRAEYKCSKCSRWEDVALAFIREDSIYSPPICRRCRTFYKEKKKKSKK